MEFERKVLGIFSKCPRLKELQDKMCDVGLLGDEVYEFIYLDRKELSDRVAELEVKNFHLLGKVDDFKKSALYTEFLGSGLVEPSVEAKKAYTILAENCPKCFTQMIKHITGSKNGLVECGGMYCTYQKSLAYNWSQA